MAVPTIPTAADFGKHVTVSGKKINYAAKSIPSTTPSAPAIAKKQDIALSPGNEQGKKFVDNYIRHNDEDLNVVKKRSEGPFTIIDSVLGHYGLPLQLKYLAVIESELKPSALSRVGARGPWQLMPRRRMSSG